MMQKAPFQLTVLLVMLLLILAVNLLPAAAQESGAEPTEEVRIATVLNATANIRSSPSTDHKAIGTLRAGEQVRILEDVPDGQAVSGNRLWYRILLPNRTAGYIWSGALSPVELDSAATTVNSQEAQIGDRHFIFDSEVGLTLEPIDVDVLQAQIDALDMSLPPPNFDLRFTIRDAASYYSDRLDPYKYFGPLYVDHSNVSMALQIPETIEIDGLTAKPQLHFYLYLSMSPDDPILNRAANQELHWNFLNYGFTNAREFHTNLNALAELYGSHLFRTQGGLRGHNIVNEVEETLTAKRLLQPFMRIPLPAAS